MNQQLDLLAPPPDLAGYKRIEWEYPHLRDLTTFSAEWYRAYRTAHLAKYPDVDLSSRLNLDMFVSLAEEREARDREENHG